MALSEFEVIVGGLTSIPVIAGIFFLIEKTYGSRNYLTKPGKPTSSPKAATAVKKELPTAKASDSVKTGKAAVKSSSSSKTKSDQPKASVSVEKDSAEPNVSLSEKELKKSKIVMKENLNPEQQVTPAKSE